MRARTLALLLLAAAGCAEEFTPRSVLFGLRVLAIRASPLELEPGESVTLDAVRLAPPGGIRTERWTFCPFSIGSSVGYVCAVPACEVPLFPAGAPTEHVSAPVTADPTALALACLGVPELPPELPLVEVLFRYVVEASDGSRREAVQRLPFYPQGRPVNENVPPDVLSVAAGPEGGPLTEVWPLVAATPVLRPGAPLDVLVRVSPDSAQAYRQGDRELTESLVVSFYTTLGRFDFDRANGPDARVTLEYDEIPEHSVPLAGQLWAVARDLRGGQTVVGPLPFTVE